MTKHGFTFALFFMAMIFMTNASAAELDVHTQSNYDQVPVRHMILDLELDMAKKVFSGFVILYFDRQDLSRKLALDTQGLEIDLDRITISNDEETWNETRATLGKKHEVLGSLLEIDITNRTTMVKIPYRTTSEAKGIDWVAKEHTADGKFPMVSTQFQAIMARSFVPCQDTPSNRITYDARIHLASVENGERAIMAAMKRERTGNTFEFQMLKPIPTYLIALRAGVFEERVISDRVSVFAEPSLVDKAAIEFADAEKMVAAAEKVFGRPYDWGRFDIMLMSPSFSYGGMENPTLTFIGPTVLAGDQSLVDVIAHELAHSWTGNLVGNQNWNHFWLNEGFTMYGERLIVQELYGKNVRDMDILLGQQILKDNIDSFEKEEHQSLTALRLHLSSDFDPDDAVSYIPYEKGFNFLYWLEQKYGAEALLMFLRQYINNYAFKSISTEDLRADLTRFFGTDLDTKELDDWLYEQGIPKTGLPRVESKLINDAAKFASDTGISTTVAFSKYAGKAAQFHSKQWSYFLKNLKKADAETIWKLEKQFQLSQKNSEIRSDFFLRVVQAGMRDFDEQIRDYLANTGRIKYVKPIYQALKQHREEDVQEFFGFAKAHYNPITTGAIERTLKMSQ